MSQRHNQRGRSRAWRDTCAAFDPGIEAVPCELHPFDRNKFRLSRSSHLHLRKKRPGAVDRPVSDVQPPKAVGARGRLDRYAVASRFPRFPCGPAQMAGTDGERERGDARLQPVCNRRCANESAASLCLRLLSIGQTMRNAAFAVTRNSNPVLGGAA